MMAVPVSENHSIFSEEWCRSKRWRYSLTVTRRTDDIALPFRSALHIVSRLASISR
jgi:hypothetical protein